MNFDTDNTRTHITVELPDPGGLFIGGQWIQTDEQFDVHDPATGDILATVADATAEETHQAISAAHNAFGAWSGLSGRDRALGLMEMHKALRADLRNVARVMTAEQGKPLGEAEGELTGCLEFLEWYAEEAKRQLGTVIGGYTQSKRQIVIHQPVGVVAAITPWNFPAMMVVRKAASALAAGCTFLVKPAEQTPLTALKLAQVFQDALPPGVFNVITTSRPAEVGAAIIEDHRVRHLTFTGSTEVGRHLGSAATKQLKRISLELGGHAPFLVFPDADLDLAIEQLTITKFKNAGQTCVCPNRIMVHHSIADEFTSRFAERAEALKVGPGHLSDTEMGPLIDEAAIHKVQLHIDDALSNGAQIVTGGARLGDQGYFYAPTVITGVHKGMKLLGEETFGPVAPIIGFDNEAEAIEMANSGGHGLTAYAYTRDLERAVRLAERLEYGVVGINDNRPGSVQTPFGGWKDSGIGRESGREGLEEFLETKTVSIGISE